MSAHEFCATSISLEAQQRHGLLARHVRENDFRLFLCSEDSCEDETRMNPSVQVMLTQTAAKSVFDLR
jgi:hypothetical protein